MPVWLGRVYGFSRFEAELSGFDMRILFAIAVLCAGVFWAGPVGAQDGAEDYQESEEYRDGRAFYFQKEACEGGNAEACTFAGSLQLRSGGPDREAEAVEYIKRGCEMGDSTGCMMEGLLILQNVQNVEPQEVVRGMKLIKCACEEDENPQACVAANNYPSNGQTCQSLRELLTAAGDTRSVEERAADGEAGAQFQLGGRYLTGDGVAVDHAQAIEWFTKAAEQGNVGGQRMLGLFYEFGESVPKDLSKATDLYRSAAEQGDVVSQYKVAVVLSNQDNPQHTVYEAVKWYELVAERDGSQFPKEVSGALFDLVLLGYARAGTVNHTPEEVTAMLRKARDLGSEDAREELAYHCEDYPDACG